MKVPALLFVLPVTLLSAGLSGCGVSETDTNRFETAAARIAAIPLEPGLTAGEATAAKPEPLRVELMTPHQLWDARDGVVPPAARVITLNAADLSDMATGTVPVQPEQTRSSVTPTANPVLAQTRQPVQGERTIQLGAYTNQASAQAAWERLAAVTQGLSPVFEPVNVNGRGLVRLKVSVTSAQAQSLCAVAASSDSWCLKAER